jgi:signal transduction histidine kinase
LAIAKWAVEVNGGHISVEAARNGGSVFRIVLPVGATPAVNAANMPLAGREDR